MSANLFVNYSSEIGENSGGFEEIELRGLKSPILTSE
jgi:hypothetical protein